MKIVTALPESPEPVASPMTAKLIRQIFSRVAQDGIERSFPLFLTAAEKATLNRSFRTI